MCRRAFGVNRISIKITQKQRINDKLISNIVCFQYLMLYIIYTTSDRFWISIDYFIKAGKPNCLLPITLSFPIENAIKISYSLFLILFSFERYWVNFQSPGEGLDLELSYTLTAFIQPGHGDRICLYKPYLQPGRAAINLKSPLKTRHRPVFDKVDSKFGIQTCLKIQDG